MKKKNQHNAYASIDVGTTSARILIKNEDKIIVQESHRILLGEGMFANDNNFTDDAIKRAITTFENFEKQLKEHNVEEYRAVATAAARTSKNSSFLIDAIKEKTNIDLEVISGEEEARLTSLGAASAIKCDKDFAVLFDIGGGSTEIIFAKKDCENLGIIDSVSLPFGGKNLGEKLDVNSYDKEKIKQIHSALEKPIQDFIKKNNLEKHKGNISFVGISGVGLRVSSAVNKTDGYDREKAHGLTCSKEGLQSYLESIEDKNLFEIEKTPYVGENRGQTYIVASIILEKIFDELEVDYMTASLSGLKEGVLIELQQKTREYKNQNFIQYMYREVGRKRG